MAIKQTGQKDISNRKLARLFGVDESTVRYHVARGKKPDGRGNKPQKAEQLAQVITHWLGHNKPDPGRRPNARALWEYLVDGYGYTGSYRSVVRYLDRHLSAAPLRPRRRVETPPGIQAQAETESEAKELINRAMSYYNRDRLHSALDYVAPDQYINNIKKQKQPMTHALALA